MRMTPIGNRRSLAGLLALALVVISRTGSAQPAPSRITILSDAFGKPSALDRSWGFSALVEYKGKRVLFDTGGQLGAFANNVERLHVDLTKLDFVVLSHRHGDHTAGLAQVLKVNPSVRVYAPLEKLVFAAPVDGNMARAVNRDVAALSPDLRYFGGKHEETYAVDSSWPGAHFLRIDKPEEVSPGFFLFRTISEEKGTLELAELSMGVVTPKGMFVVVGCSHPGIEKILTAAQALHPKFYSVAGGLHLIDKSDQQVTELVERLRDQWKMERIAAGHCTGAWAQSEMERVFGARHDHSGVGEVIPLPGP